MRWLYNVLFGLGFVASAPWYFLKMARRGDWRPGMRERFGHYSTGLKHALTNRDAVWVHGVSVGETNLALQLAPALQERLPNYKFVMSTTTSTGMQQLRNGASRDVSVIYYPLDFRKCVQRALAVIHPEVMVLMEAELWPNMLWGLSRRGIPVILVNARISARSFRRYRMAGFIFRELFGRFAAVGAQSQADADRLIALGCRPETVHVLGALKFDSAAITGPLRVDVGAVLKQLGVDPGALVLVGGSTHAGEEAMLGRVAQRLRGKHPSLFLIVVPRHQERGAEVGRDLAAVGAKCEFRTMVTPAFQRKPGELDCLIVNTTGELRAFYARADVVFVGKSLLAKGGQNPIEPAALGKPVLFGPHMDNFPDIARRFRDSGAAQEVQDEAALEAAVDALLSDREAARAMGARAKEIVEESQGALKRTVEMVVAAAAVTAGRQSRGRSGGARSGAGPSA